MKFIAGPTITTAPEFKNTIEWTLCLNCGRWKRSDNPYLAHRYGGSCVDSDQSNLEIQLERLQDKVEAGQWTLVDWGSVVRNTAFIVTRLF